VQTTTLWVALLELVVRVLEPLASVAHRPEDGLLAQHVIVVEAALRSAVQGGSG